MIKLNFKSNVIYGPLLVHNYPNVFMPIDSLLTASTGEVPSRHDPLASRVADGCDYLLIIY